MRQIETIHLFPELTQELITLLRELDLSEWEKVSPIKERTVKDLVSHLIDGSLRRLAFQRDKYTSKSLKVDIKSYTDLVDYIQKLNKDWILITERLSPKILIDILEYSESQLYDFFKTLEPDNTAIFSVAWAGEDVSKNWFDIAREFTEKWHHQMQIRLALNKSLLMDKKYIEPLYNTFMLGLPYLYRDMIDYPTGETLKITLTGNLNKSWILEKQPDNWLLIENAEKDINTTIEISENDAWLIFTNTDRDKEKYKKRINFIGDKDLGLKLLDFVTVMS
ncbi:hypothetical protein ES705_40491 [subsurface metagenome]